MRGGDFWQGAAAGAFGSFAGTASGALGINDGWMIAISAFTGGVGSYVAGGRSVEEILFGVVSGAMVGALNFAEGEVKEKTYEVMLRERLQQIKVGESISVDELKELGLVGTIESLAFNSIKRVSDNRFTVDRTLLGCAKISSDAYFDINVNGSMQNGVSTVRGIRITLHGIPSQEVQITNTTISVKVSDYVLHGNSCYFPYENTFKSFSVK